MMAGPFPRHGRVSLREDLLHHDPLLACLVQLTDLHGRPSTRAAQDPPAGSPAGEPLLIRHLSPRGGAAGLSSKIVRRPRDIDSALLLVILLLKGDEAARRPGWSARRRDGAPAFPETGQAK